MGGFRMELLRTENLSYSYENCTEYALKDLSCVVERGDFVVVSGTTGSGKSTFLRMLKPELTPPGERDGSVLLFGTPVENLSGRESAAKIGFVMQNPQLQAVTDKVWHELAFGLENMGMPQELIRRRVSEIACYFGIEDWFSKDVSELSGGQLQLLNLASVMVMQPELLLLDEPTAQLDPIAAADFLQTLSRLNRELSVTVILVEHHLEEALPLANRLMILRDGRLAAFGHPKDVILQIMERDEIPADMPAAVRLFAGLKKADCAQAELRKTDDCAQDELKKAELTKEGYTLAGLKKEAESKADFAAEQCPVSVREGRNYLEAGFRNDIRNIQTECRRNEKKVLEFRDVFCRYGTDMPDVLNGLSFSVYEKEIFCLLGGNGSGKSTTLMCAAGLLKYYAGDILVFGKKLRKYNGRELYRECLSMLPQDVQSVFLRNTVREELEDVQADIDSLPFDLKPVLQRHPYDLSGGQQQMAALAKVLSSKPKLLLLDEPTKGLDAAARRNVRDVLWKLCDSGMTIVLVTHDVEFAAETADRCAMLFRGEIVSCGEPRAFFSGNSFYTTAFSRMTRGFYDNAVTYADTMELCIQNGRK